MDRNCEICNKEFSTPYSYRRHYAKAHKLQNSTQDKQSTVVVVEQPESEPPPSKKHKITNDPTVNECELMTGDGLVDETITPLWTIWIKENAQRMNIKTWPEIETNYINFTKHLRNLVQKRINLYQRLIKQDSIYNQLKQEQNRLYQLGYTVPGEAWNRAWSNRRLLIRSLVSQVVEEIRTDPKNETI